MLDPFPFSELHDWYKIHGRHDLPWRDYNFSTKQLGYRVWLAETMLQQTQVERVKTYFLNILEAFPTIEDLAACSYEKFFPYYKGLGYYSRARNMLKAAQGVVDDFGGIFPEETSELRSLPGVGPYTAEAIRAFAYDIPTLSFDTNLEKIFSRYYYGNKFQKLSKEEKGKLVEQFNSYITHLGISSLKPHGGGIQNAPPRLKGSRLKSCGGISRDINNALMDYGATVSLNNISGIDWKNYPLPSSKFYQTRGELEPVKEKKKSTFPNKQAFVIAILHENHKQYYSPSIPLHEGEKKLPSLGEGLGESFKPFLIGKNSGNPRSQIQNYFLEKYHLELSVRPPEIKSYNKYETPYLVCYCQIQSGNHDFGVFKNIKIRGFEEGYVEKLDFGENTLS